MRDMAAIYAASLASIDPQANTYGQGERCLPSSRVGIKHADALKTPAKGYPGVRAEKEKMNTEDVVNLTQDSANGDSQQFSLHPEGVAGTYNLGLLYAQGKVLEQDKAKAVELYEKAHAAGFVKATYNLGLMYQRGEGVEQDCAMAAKLYAEAHAKGYPKATYNLARMYERGEGCPQDSEMAAKLFEQLTKQKTDAASLRTHLKKGSGKPILAFNVDRSS
jgi:TPR repeat protein